MRGKSLSRSLQDEIYNLHIQNVDSKVIAERFGITWPHCLTVIRRARLAVASNEPVDLETLKPRQTASVERRIAAKEDG